MKLEKAIAIVLDKALGKKAGKREVKAACQVLEDHLCSKKTAAKPKKVERKELA
jgi:hypothetical protein